MGCFLPTIVCGGFSPHLLSITSLLLSHCPVQQGVAWFQKDHGHYSVSPPAPPSLPTCHGLDKTEKAPAKQRLPLQTI